MKKLLEGDQLAIPFPHTWQLGDHCHLECWGDRLAVVVALAAKNCAPVLGYDCQVQLEKSGQVVPYHLSRLIWQEGGQHG